MRATRPLALAMLVVCLHACRNVDLPVGGSPTEGCRDGTKLCGDQCVDASDPLYGCRLDTCAPCALPNAELVSCRTGECTLETCRLTYAHCSDNPADGCETDLRDPSTCGSCDAKCSNTESCSKRGCGPCDVGEASCSGRCVDLQTNVDHCGNCKTKCESGSNLNRKCKAGKCTIKCDDGFDDCDGNPANGCEPLVVVYRDEDHDHFGTNAGSQLACPSDHDVSVVGGDCDDRTADAHPGQTAYFTVGYVIDNQLISFDYDCDGKETPLEGAVLGSCSGTFCIPGYAPAPSPGGSAAATHCGSTKEFTCLTGGCPTRSAQPLGCR